ncbi:hypothetical protein GCM10007939_17020 [Amylibacter marinus]|uniref:DNA translocase FtsK n=1 Tax=Amylibacter marinus TaxID=1475483 RepID=A0ABQ5VWA1_9RHOB|nr:DNA translocase FtsK [Amylibacter marinus]GLQ35419.1 hypothetical protein GCM10007939_17020 [Amylibacter marinus]
MAYNTRTRDPLLEAQMQATIRKRFAELVGLGLIALAVVAAIALWTYHKEDPNFLNATSGSVQNKMGLIGAAFAGNLMLTIGKAAWLFPVAFLVWGVRMLLHIGQARLFRRGVFLPITITLAAVFLATNIPSANWPYDFSMGGLSGDAILKVIMDFAPLESGLWIRVLSLGLGLASFCLGLFSLGFTGAETKHILQRGTYTLIIWANLLGAGFAALTRMGYKGAKAGTSSALATAANARQRAKERRENHQDDMPDISVDHHMPSEPKAPKHVGRKTLFPTLPVFANKSKDRPTEPDAMAETPPTDSRRIIYNELNVSGQKERVTKRIREAIRNKDAFASATAPMEVIDDEDVISPVQEPVIPANPQIHTAPENIFEDDLGDSENIFADVSAPIESVPELALDAIPPRKEPTFKKLTPPKSVVEHAPQKPIPQSSQAKSEAQPTLFTEAAGDYETPALNLLASPSSVVRHQLSDEALEENARMLENVLDDYGVKGEIISVRPGPVVTMYELEPAPGLKASRVVGLADDIARSMSALAARVSTVPGRTVIGIELPNDNRETVLLREILSARDYGDGKHSLPLALGKDISGKPEVSDLAKMPHLLIAGTTGSGKSVAINTMIMSLLYKLRPDECRMIMIDPKMLELSVYDGIPHLLSPVVTDPKKAVVALKWVVGEMEERYRKMSKMGVRNIAGYNSRVEDALSRGENFERTVQTGFDDDTGEPVFETESFAPEKMPFIVIVVDEMADLMMVAGKEIEACIQRLAQMARASGIHLIMATQRPSVDVITGTIKANFPTRISFQVTSKIDSRTILGEMGAEQLLGMGDMLYMAGGGKVTRIHAPFVSDEEVEVVVNHLKSYGPPEYVSTVVKGPDEAQSSNIDAVLGLGGNTSKENALYDQAVAIVAQDRKCSTSYIQRKLSIGYNKAAKLVEEMEDNGVVSAANHVGKREILLPEQN